MKSRKALLVIDMQKGSFTSQSPRLDTPGTVDRINQLSRLFRMHDFPVIWIQHDGRGKDEFKKNSWAWELLDELTVEASDTRIDKYVNDSFYKSELQDRLVELEVQQLVITGCATDFCVESTIQSALSKDYSITVVADGHTTADRPHITAKKVIEHYNWVWKNMIPTQGKIVVESCKSILNSHIVSHHN